MLAIVESCSISLDQNKSVNIALYIRFRVLEQYLNEGFNLLSLHIRQTCEPFLSEIPWDWKSLELVGPQPMSKNGKINASKMN